MNHHHYISKSGDLFLWLVVMISIILTFTPSLIRAFFIDHNTSPRQEEWSYAKQNEWHHYFPLCGEQSKRQSPINIKRENVITNHQLIMKFYNYNRRIRFNIQNAHHTIKMNPIPDHSNKQNDYGNSQTFDINTLDEMDSMPVGPPLPIGNTLPGGRLPSQQLSSATIMNNNNQLDHHNSYDSDDAPHQYPQQQQQQQQQHNSNNKRSFSQNNQNLQYPKRQRPFNNPTAATTDVHTGGLEQQQQQTGNSDYHYKNPTHQVDPSTASINTLQQQQQQQHQQSHHQSDTADHELHNDYLQQQQLQKLPYDGVPMIKLDWMDDHNNEYRLHDIHFHWGTNKDNGSEHLIDGRKSAMEMHLVHIKKGLKKDQIGYNSDSVVVIAVLIESYRKSNANFNPIVNTLTSINVSDTSHVIEYSSINDLLPNDRAKFYTYYGSLTTPPCYEVVNWIVMNERVYINAKQMEMFRNIYARIERNHNSNNNNNKFQLDNDTPANGNDGDGDGIYRIMPNVRNRQSPRSRPIMASFSLNNVEQSNEIDNELISGASETAYLSFANTGYNLFTLLTTSLFISFYHYSYY